MEPEMFVCLPPAESLHCMPRGKLIVEVNYYFRLRKHFLVTRCTSALSIYLLASVGDELI